MNVFEEFEMQLDDTLRSVLNADINRRRELMYTPKRILKSGNATIVFWNDGTKTVVRCASDETPCDYDAFTAALAIKIFGSNSHLKKMIKAVTVEQKPKKGKE